jgi:hypothetical protein
MKYILKSSVEIEFKDNELFIIDNETGFVGTGNKNAYQVLDQMHEAKTEEEIIQALKPLYSESQHPRIEKSVPKIIEWALEREIIKTN